MAIHRAKLVVVGLALVSVSCAPGTVTMPGAPADSDVGGDTVGGDSTGDSTTGDGPSGDGGGGDTGCPTSTRTVPCGLNDRGSLPQTCAGGVWTDSGACTDPDECTDDDTQNNVACGFNDRGTVDQTCVTGQWQDDAACVDPDECEDNTTQAGSTLCGFNDRGTYVQDCNSGTWEDDTNDCDDPDECEDTTTQPGTTGCDLFGPNTGELDQECVTGHWQDSSTCGYNGPTGCDTCHDAFADASPWAGLDDVTDTTDDEVGAHDIHVHGGSITGKSFACSECHIVPSAWDDDGHIYEDPVSPGVEVYPGGSSFDGLAAARDAVPSYDDSTGTCSNVYCHGGGGNLINDTSTTVLRDLVWTTAGTGVVTCSSTVDPPGASCHGLQPVYDFGTAHELGHSPRLITSCVTCHGSTIDSAGDLTGNASHVDGATPSP